MTASRTVAVIDVGSNSIKLLVARGTSVGGVEPLIAETIETRISEGISSELPQLTGPAMDAGESTILELVKLARRYQPEAQAIVATSAVRDALNGPEFAERIGSATGIPVRVLSGDEEARAVGQGVACDPGLRDVSAFTQMDIGGGSLEFHHFDDGDVRDAVSLPLGAVRLTERFVAEREAPIDEGTEAAIRKHVQTTVLESGFPIETNTRAFVVTGGAFVVTRAILAARAGVPIELHPPELGLEAIRALRAELGALPLHERMAVPHLPARRADILPTALITIETVMRLAKREAVHHSFCNLRYGIAAELLEQAS